MPLDVRVGSSTNALRPILAAERPLGAGLRQWVSLAAIVVAAVAADQPTKQVVARALALGEEVQIAGPFSLHHVRNSGIAFGFFSSATSIVIVVTAIAVGWMLVFTRSGRRHPVLPVALGLVLGGSLGNLLDRCGSVTSPTSSTSASGPRSTSPTSSSWSASRPLRGARGRRPLETPAAEQRCPLSAFSPLRRNGSIGPSPEGPRSARGLSPSG